VPARLTYTWQAEEDLAAMFAWFASTNRARARDVLRGIEERCEALLDFPMLGRARDDIKQGLRTLPIARGTVVYRLLEDEVEIVRVFPKGSDFERILRSG
jgi:toxin ParE1/3/4